MPVDVLALPASSLSTKWKEPYASASINQKLTGIIAPGIYRGLRLAEDPLSGDRTVVVAADPTRGDHVAVYENADGFSVTYRDDVSGDITISLSSYSNTVVLVTLFVDYTPGSPTTGTFRGYTQAEYNILTASIKDHLVILGTVAVPVAGAISPSSISLLNRTLASTNLPSGAIANAPIVRNPGFELGEVNGTYVKSSIFWDKSVTAGSGTWKTSTTDVDTGLKAIEMNLTSIPFTGDLSQQVGIETAENELFIIEVRIKQLKTVSSGTIAIFLEWSDLNDAVLSTTTTSLNGGAIDSAFRTVSNIVGAPAGAVSLRSVGIRATALSPSSTGIFAYIDSVNVYVAPRNTKRPYPFDESFRRAIAGQALALLSPSGTFAAQTPVLSFDPSTPSSEGQVSLSTLNPASIAYALSFLGRIRQLGSGQLGAESDALKPRIEAPYGVVAGVDYTLLWESTPVSGSTAATRWYVTPTGTMLWTTNAKWGSPTANQWNKDVSGVAALKFEVTATAQSWQLRDASLNASWLDSAWDAQRVFRPVNDSSPSYITEVRDSAGVLRHGMRPVVHAGTIEPAFEIVDSTGQRRFVIDHLGFPNQRIVTRSFWWDQPFGGDPEAGWTYLTSGANSNIITGNSSPTYGAGGCNLLVLSGSALNGFARAFYTPFLHAFNNNSLINALCVVSWSIHVGQQDSRKMVMGLCDSLLFTPGSTDFVGFYRLESDANWKAYTGEGVNQTTTDTGVAVTDASEHQMRIEYQGTGYPGGFATRFFIDDVLVATHTTANRQPNSNLGFLFRADNTSSFAWGSSIAFTSTIMTITLTPQDNLTGRKT